MIEDLTELFDSVLHAHLYLSVVHQMLLFCLITVALIYIHILFQETSAVLSNLPETRFDALEGW